MEMRKKAEGNGLPCLFIIVDGFLCCCFIWIIIIFQGEKCFKKSNNGRKGTSERHRERERQIDRETDNQRPRETKMDRERHTERKIERQIYTYTDRERQRDAD